MPCDVWHNVKANDVDVTADASVVTLTGTVRTYAERHAAQEAAHRVHGVLDVVNEMAMKIPGVGVRIDTEVAQTVRQALENESTRGG